MTTRILFTVATILFLSSTGSGAEVGDPTATAATPEEAAAATIRDDVTRVVDRVQTQRGGMVPPGFQAARSTRDQRDAVVEAAVAGRLSRERLVSRGAAWADLGLDDPEAPARLLRRLEGDLESAVLDAGGLRLLIADEVLTDRDFLDTSEENVGSAVLLATGIRPDEPLVAHMVVHALQRSRSRSPAAVPVTTDAILARRAWEEGEANLIAIGLLFQGLRLPDAVLQPGIDPAAILDGRLVSPGLQSLPQSDSVFLEFVYQEGYAQAVRAFRGGGFRALEQAMAGRNTTRDVLHPDRSLPPIQERPPIRRPAEAGFDLADEDSLGELGIFALVSRRTGKDDLALAAADGWQFDRLVRWETKPADPATAVTTWETQWNSDEDASEFVYAFGRVVEDGFGGAALTDETSGRRAWSASNRVYRIERQGKNANIRIAGASTDANLEKSGAPPSTPPRPQKVNK